MDVITLLLYKSLQFFLGLSKITLKLTFIPDPLKNLYLTKKSDFLKKIVYLTNGYGILRLFFGDSDDEQYFKAKFTASSY